MSNVLFVNLSRIITIANWWPGLPSQSGGACRGCKFSGAACTGRGNVVFRFSSFVDQSSIHPETPASGQDSLAGVDEYSPGTSNNVDHRHGGGSPALHVQSRDNNAVDASPSYSVLYLEAGNHDAGGYAQELPSSLSNTEDTHRAQHRAHREAQHSRPSSRYSAHGTSSGHSNVAARLLGVGDTDVWQLQDTTEAHLLRYFCTTLVPWVGSLRHADN